MSSWRRENHFLFAGNVGLARCSSNFVRVNKLHAVRALYNYLAPRWWQSCRALLPSQIKRSPSTGTTRWCDIWRVFNSIKLSHGWFFLTVTVVPSKIMKCDFKVFFGQHFSVGAGKKDLRSGKGREQKRKITGKGDKYLSWNKCLKRSWEISIWRRRGLKRALTINEPFHKIVYSSGLLRAGSVRSFWKKGLVSPEQGNYKLVGQPDVTRLSLSTPLTVSWVKINKPQIRSRREHKSSEWLNEQWIHWISQIAKFHVRLSRAIPFSPRQSSFVFYNCIIFQHSRVFQVKSKCRCFRGQTETRRET